MGCSTASATSSACSTSRPPFQSHHQLRSLYRPAALLGERRHGCWARERHVAAVASSMQPDLGGSSAAAAADTGAAAAAPASLHLPRPVKAEGASNVLEIELNDFRRGVGLCIYRPTDGLVFAARRMDDTAQSWQMPQGGIDPREHPERAALRELHEETGITSCRIVASIDHWLDYTFPTKVKSMQCSRSLLRYRGQTQKWFLLEFLGDDSEIDLSCHGHPEFSEYTWAALEALPAGVVDFKRPVYAQVARHFGPEIERRCKAAASSSHF